MLFRNANVALMVAIFFMKMFQKNRKSKTVPADVDLAEITGIFSVPTFATSASRTGSFTRSPVRSPIILEISPQEPKMTKKQRSITKRAKTAAKTKKERAKSRKTKGRQRSRSTSSERRRRIFSRISSSIPISEPRVTIQEMVRTGMSPFGTLKEHMSRIQTRTAELRAAREAAEAEERQREMFRTMSRKFETPAAREESILERAARKSGIKIQLSARTPRRRLRKLRSRRRR